MAGVHEPARREVANVYVHAPFCARRCCYCDFAVTVDRTPDGTRWLDALRAEFEALRRTEEVRLAEELDTLYVGGGTPSVLDPRAIAALPAVIGCAPTRGAAVEWTVEANPESFAPRVAGEWASAGVNRVSFGVQSFAAPALEWMGRLHSAGDVTAAIATARAAGLTNLSIDLIFGLPGHLDRSWERDVQLALTLEVPHISLYGLTVEKGTALARLVREGRASMPDGQRYRDEYLFAVETLKAAGYQHYEVSNFARPGFASRHNRACWRGAPYLGLGNGAHSYHGGRRWWNIRDWEKYVRRVEATGSGRAGSETPTEGQRQLEALWLALRTVDGVDRAALGPAASPVLRKWQTQGLASPANGRLHLTPEGWLVLDDLTLELDAALGNGVETRPGRPDPTSVAVDDGVGREIFNDGSLAMGRS